MSRDEEETQDGDAAEANARADVSNTDNDAEDEHREQSSGAPSDYLDLSEESFFAYGDMVDVVTGPSEVTDNQFILHRFLLVADDGSNKVITRVKRNQALEMSYNKDLILLYAEVSHEHDSENGGIRQHLKQCLKHV